MEKLVQFILITRVQVASVLLNMKARILEPSIKFFRYFSSLIFDSLTLTHF